MKETKFLNNKTQISAYKKNLQYGSGGDVIIQNSLFENSKNEFYSRKSNILIENTKIIGKVFKDGKNIIINDYSDLILSIFIQVLNNIRIK